MDYFDEDYGKIRAIALSRLLREKITEDEQRELSAFLRANGVALMLRRTEDFIASEIPEDTDESGERKIDLRRKELSR